VGKTQTIWLRSLAVGLAAGLAAFAVFYAFFLGHGELGVQPASAWWIGAGAFALGLVASLIYLALKAPR
jgi:hypothetical protein